MNIQPISNFNSNPAFKSIRSDKKTVSQLKSGEKPIIENSRQNIYAALNNLSAAHDRSVIEFLLDIADNQAYGQGKNSEFKNALDADGITPEERENTDWTQLLADTIEKSLSEADEDVSDLKTEYDRIFNETKPLTEEQKNILNLRKEITKKICSEEMLKDDESLERVTDIRKNLDYFAASSEVSAKEKQECLEKFVYLLSDDYQINRQLQDKKLRVLDEILNDITVKAPDDEVLRTKAIDQRGTGMCASISICRKMMAHEDKSRYTDLVLEELNSSNIMNVYDVTELGSGKKVSIPKAIVDYDAALEKGYRITDTAAHIWMNSAHASGDGTNQTETYIPFDSSTYGIFDDASWYNGLEDQSKKFLLMALIKENENINSAIKTKKFISESATKLQNAKKDAIEGKAVAYSRIEQNLSDVFPDKHNNEIRNLADSVIKFYTGKTDGTKVNVPAQLPKESKNNLIAKFLYERIPDADEEQKAAIKEKSENIRQMTEEYTGYDKEIKALNKFNTPAGRYRYNNNLFKAAAAHRIALEADLDLDDGVVRFERKSGLAPRKNQILNYLEGIKNNAGSDKVRNKFPDKNGKIPSRETFEKSIEKDIFAIDTEIPAQINSIIKKLTGEEFTEVIAQMYGALSAEIKNGNEDFLLNVAEMMNLKKDKTIVLNRLDKTEEKLRNNPTDRDKNEAVRMLGYEDEVQLATTVLASFYEGLNNGISEEEYKRLTETFGGENKVKNGINIEHTRFNSIVKKYSNILSRWQVPGARDLIMKKLENENFVLSTESLDTLYSKFNDIQKQRVKNEAIQNPEERRKANNAVFKFDENENALFDKIEKSLPSMRKYGKITYANVNKALQPYLDEQYSNIGMLNGQFWVREEGSQGLSGNEQIRIIEQMTGKPYHLERDVLIAAKEIKKGNGSGILGMSVDDTDYGFHAQYIPAVTEERLTNPLTGKEEIKDILWTDNSWGKAEKDSYWDGGDGFIHTDYGQGLGWKNGFMVSPDFKIGLPVDEIDGAIGYCERDKEEFGLFTDIVLPGTPVDTYQKLYKMFSYIFTMGADELAYKELEKEITSSKEKIDIKRLTGLDEIVSIRSQSLYSRLDKTIKSKEDFDKLPQDDELKFTFEKLALYFSTIDVELRESVLSACTPEELEQVKDEITEVQISSFGSILAKSDATVQNVVAFSQADVEKVIDDIGEKYGEKQDNKELADILNTIFYDKEKLETIGGSLTELEEYFLNGVDTAAEKFFKSPDARKYFADETKKIISATIDENIRIKSLDAPIIVNSPFKEEFIAAIDRAYEPESDEEMLEIIQELQESSFEDANELCEVLSDEELGLNFRPAYDFVKKYKTGDSDIMRALSDVIATNVLNGEIAKSDDEDKSTPEELYRSLYIKLSELDVQKFIKAFKAEAFQKYKVREAFPQPVIIPDENIAKTASNITDVIKELSANIQSNNAMGDVLEAHRLFTRRFQNTKLLNDINEGKEEIKITAQNRGQVNEMTEQISALYEKICYNENMQELTDALEVMSEELQSDSSVISGQVLHQCIDTLNSYVENLQATGMTKDLLKETNKSLVKSIKASTIQTVKANIDPKYQDEAINKMYKIVDAQRKYYAPEDVNYFTEDFIDLFTEKHITKNPPEILNECVRMIQNGEQNTDAYNAMKLYLNKALTVAQQTKVQYKLVQNEHAGIGSKTKDMLSLFGVTLNNGQKETLDSDVGILYLVNQLNNSGNNYQTLNLFLNQTGLSKQALRAIIANCNFDKLKEIGNEQTENAKELIGQLEELYSSIHDFLSQSKIKYTSIEDCSKQVNNFIERKYGKDKSEVVEDYLNYMNSVVFKKESYSFGEDLILPYFDILKTEAFQCITDSKINSKFEVISEIAKNASEKIDLAYAIDIPENSEESEARKDFENEFIELNEYLKKKYDEIKESVANSELLHT